MSDKFPSVEQQASYGIGRQIADQLSNEPFPGFDRDAALEGFTDHLMGNAMQLTAGEINSAFGRMQERLEALQAEQKDELSAAGAQFLEDNAKRDEVSVTESGLQYEVITVGEGDKPVGSSTVRTHYHGTLVNGTVFDSSYDRGEPAEFPVNGVIAGWTEALQMMPVGSKWRLYIPYNLAYGERGAGGVIGPYETLIFDIELLDIIG